MKAEQIDRILEAIPGARKEGVAHLVPEDGEVSIYVALPSEVLTIARLSRIERGGELTVVDTHQGDRYYVPTDSICIIKVGTPSKRSVGRGTGFR